MSEQSNGTISDETVRSWLQSKAVIRVFLQELLPDPGRTLAREDALATALVARLANDSPPLLIVTLGELEARDKAKSLLRRLVETWDAADASREDFDSIAINAVSEARKLLAGES